MELGSMGRHRLKKTEGLKPPPNPNWHLWSLRFQTQNKQPPKPKPAPRLVWRSPTYRPKSNCSMATRTGTSDPYTSDPKQAASSQTQPRDCSQGTLKTRGSSHPQTQTGTGLAWKCPAGSRLDCAGRLSLKKRKNLEPEPAQAVHRLVSRWVPGKLDICKEQVRGQERNQSSRELYTRKGQGRGGAPAGWAQAGQGARLGASSTITETP